MASEKSRKKPKPRVQRGQEAQEHPRGNRDAENGGEKGKRSLGLAGHRHWQGTGVGQDTGAEERCWPQRVERGSGIPAVTQMPTPWGDTGACPSYSGDHFDPKVFAQLLQEDKGEDGLRNEPDASRNEALEGDSKNGEAQCVPG